MKQFVALTIFLFYALVGISQDISDARKDSVISKIKALITAD